MPTEPLSPLDLAFLSLESETTPMHMAAVAVFAPRDVDDQDLAGLLAERAEQIPQLRTRARAATWTPTQAHWEDDPHFCADNHIHRHHLPAPGGRAEFADIVGHLGAEPLDLAAPAWELHLITGLEGGRFALLVKLHHALADGATGVRIGLGLLDPLPRRQRRSADEAATADESFLRQLFTSPGLIPRSVLHAAQTTVSAVGETAGIVGSVLGNARFRSATPLAATDTPSRRVAMLGLPMREVRAIRARHGGTCNEIVIAVITGAFRHWLGSRGHSLDALDLTALIPVDHRARSQTTDSSNQLSGYLCELPVGEDDPLRRLHAIRTSMAENKAAGPQCGAGAFPLVANRTHPLLHRVITPVAGQFASLLFDTMITHVPVPKVPLALAGTDLLELYPLAPIPSGHALSIGVIQYRDTIHIGLNCNRTAVPDIEKLTDAVPAAFDELHDAATDAALAALR
ncbi:wax ester/triacylglycerol synthase family O-acyltransferase [Allosaccharopolyspora coralli]|uniref:Diacylglycerol O-acyltransferase n=2 Tax=Allosaccharopolyspora coralli TaxID=2665642 RepID=A0A5Q3QND2_9PSEU|nr:wax ester/triacylglycerol synthase family O-acyltransferase [Allosaccharopolyspora coralli]